uniref:Odorant receptor 26 n=1 Tax=Athetis dissimilis TaxID=1737331 RepID=A0A0S1TQQ0_ATHDI|nr:odorant receptor 26 [Athetis dissimilis]
MDKLARVMFLLLCHVTSIAKQLVFHVKAERIDAMLSGLDDPLYNQGLEAHEQLLRVTAEGAARFVRAYAGCAVVTCTLWITFPVMYRLRGQPVEFPFWINVDYNRQSMFILVLAYSYYVTTLVGIANTTMDAFMATVLNQCKAQLRILRMEFESLPARAAALSQARAAPYEAVLLALFKERLMHYEKITETAKMLQDIFGTAILVQFGIGGWILCMAAYKIISLNVLSVEFASMTLFICCILTELFLYCYYGNEVTYESERVSQSIYSMEWRRERPAFRRSLVLVMERAKRPLRPAAGLVIPLSLDTFVKIIKSSYTFYAVLRQTK